MRLKSLHLQGFKSFASREEFVFPTGITAIVGPNGSGKSNVADAIRWGLGEQSMRSLRGKTTEDMIYTGSRRKSGMAEVLLTLDNHDGWLPVDFTEVTVGRRAYRSGENEYLLNGNRVRLRDINQLLAESGLGERTYAVVGQGLVDTALSLRPQERRALFEEAAGISVYRSEREDAAGRLDETQRNLERVRDILSEITPRLRRLRQQEDRLREHERVSAHLLRLQRAWYGYHWGQAQDRLREVRERLRVLEARVETLQTEAEETAGRLTALRRQQAEVRAHLRDAYQRTADLHDRADAAQRELATLTERIRLQAEQREEMERDVEPLRVQRDAQEERVAQARERVEELRAQVASHEGRLASLQQEVRQLQQEAQKRAAQGEQARRELKVLGRRRAKLEQETAEAHAVQVRLEAEQELLARLREEGSTLGQGVRKLLDSNLAGVKGLLGGLVRAEQEWEAAVEAALGVRTQALVVQEWRAVWAARDRLEAGERALLLPLEGVERRILQPQGELPSGARWALDVVTCPHWLQPAVESLLEGTLLVEDLQAARSALDRLPPGGRCATRAGEVVAADGTVTVGHKGSGLLAQERVWQELPERLEAARHRQAELERKSERVAEQTRALREALQQAEQGAAEVSQTMSRTEGGPLAEARTELAVARQAFENQRSLLQREHAALERLKAQLASREARVKELAEARQAGEERLAHLRRETGRFEEQLEEVRSRIGPAEESLTGLNEQQEEAETAERRARERLHRAEELAGNARLEVTRQQERITRLQERIQEDLGLVELDLADQVTAQTPLPLRPYVSPLPIVEILPEGLKEEIQHLKARLRQLGPINPNASQEYAETLERHQFLTEQVADLEKTSARLREVIGDLDRMMANAFRETFEAIAVAFEEVFARLFNGGSARLELTEPDDLLTTGVDIVARPPGKRLQSLALLSGGERALSAAALIFAILRVRPTPVCVMDEVDAMLDETNVGRFRDMLRELSGETQFIIITHNRHTVEAAGTVYGVSMRAEGISQVVSMRMTEEEGAA
jgi:chromosome segregation protein